MPLLPAAGYNRPVAPSVAPSPTSLTPYQEIRAPAEAFGAESARALTNLGQSFERVATNLGNIQDQYDKVVAQEARNRALAYSQVRLHGDPNTATDNGYLGLEGRLALDKRSETLKDLSDMYDKERRNLPTVQAQRLFDEGSAAGQFHNQALVLDHARKEFQKYRAKEAESEVGLKLNEVASASTRGDATAMRQNLGEAIIAATQSLRDRGASDAEIKSKASDLTATAVEYWSLGRAPSDPVGALAALEQNREHFTDPARYARLHGQIKGHADKAEGRKLVESTRPAAGQAVNTDIPPEGRALLDTIAGPESGGRYDIRYTPGGGASFDPAKGHPRVYEPGPEGPSSAAGRYQIVASTYDRFAPGLGITDFSERSQDAVAWAIAKDAYHKQTGGDLLEALRAGKTTEVQKALRDSKQWTTANLGSYAANLQRYGTTTTTPTAAGGIPESPLAGQVARIQASDATPEVKESAIVELNRQHAVRSLGQKEADYELTKAINRGDPSITPDYIDTLVQTQRISPADGTQAIARLEKVKEDRKKLDDAIALVDSARRGETALDPTNTDHQKAVNLDFANTAQAWKPEERWQQTLNYIGKVNVVPPQIKSAITGNLFSGNEGRATTGARQYRELVTLNPMLGEGFNADVRAMAGTLNTMAGLGMVSKEAFTQAQAQMRVPQAEQEARRKSFDSVRGTSEQDRLTNDTKAITSRHNRLMVNDPDAIPDAMLFDFREAAQTFYARTGNLDAAYQAAYDTTLIKWAPSRVGADGLRWTKNAPESLYPTPGRTDNSDWMNLQLLADVNATAPKPFKPDQLHIVPEPEVPGKKPGYFVWFFDEAGHFDYVRDSNRVPLVWRPNWLTSSTRAQEADTLRKQHEERAKAAQEKARREQEAKKPVAPQPPLPDDAPFLEKLKRVPSQQLRWPGPSGNRPQP